MLQKPGFFKKPGFFYCIYSNRQGHGWDTALLIGVNNRLKPIINVAFRRSLDPPKSPLRRGVGVDFDRNLVPPFLRGVRGDLGLIVKQQSVTGLEVKLTPMGIAVS